MRIENAPPRTVTTPLMTPAEATAAVNYLSELAAAMTEATGRGSVCWMFGLMLGGVCSALRLDLDGDPEAFRSLFRRVEDWAAERREKAAGLPPRELSRDPSRN